MNLEVMLVIIAFLAFLGLVFYIFNYQLARGELSAGDIAQFDDEQDWTYTELGTQILLYLDCKNCTATKNNSTLSDRQIKNLIMEELIVSGFSYCDVWNDELKFCENLGNQTLKDKFVRDTYIKLVIDNQPEPLEGLLKLFGG
jgi:hypothetical protein